MSFDTRIQQHATRWKLPHFHKRRMIFPVALMHLLKVLAYLFVMLFFNMHRMPGCHSPA